MNTRFIPSVAVAILMMIPSTGSAQVSAEVTLEMPIELAKLSPDITKVRVECRIFSYAIPASTPNRTAIQSKEFPVVDGALRTMVYLPFSFTGLENPVGQQADLGCTLTGWSQAQQKWDQFRESHPDPVFRTNPTLNTVNGRFVW
jgi:hypothetical protein